MLKFAHTEYTELTRKQFFAYKKRMEIVDAPIEKNYHGFAYVWHYRGYITDAQGGLWQISLRKTNSPYHANLQYRLKMWPSKEKHDNES